MNKKKASALGLELGVLYIAMYWTMYGQQGGVIGLNSHQR